MIDSYRSWQEKKRSIRLERAAWQEKRRVLRLPPSAGISTEVTLKDWFADKPCCWITAWEIETWWWNVGGARGGHGPVMRKLGFISKLQRIDETVIRIWDREQRRLPPLPY